MLEFCFLPAAFALAPQNDLFDLPQQDPRLTELLGVEDIDQDGDPDFLVPVPNPNPGGQVFGMGWLLNDGTGELQTGPITNFVYPPPATPLGPSTAFFLLTPPATGDFDGDGNQDIAYTRNNSNPPPPFGVGPVYAIGVFFTDGTGATSSSWVGEDNPSSDLFLIGAGQADADAAEELLVVVVNGNFQRLQWLDWTGARLELLSEIMIEGNPETIKLADFNGDGISDIARVSDALGVLNIATTLPGGILTQGVDVTLPAAATGERSALVPADYDGDGDSDLMHLGWNEGSDFGFLHLLDNQNGLFASQPVQAFSEPNALERTSNGLAYPSASGTGSDVIAIDEDGVHTHFVRSVGGLFTAQNSTCLGSSSWTEPRPLDLNGDGNLDLAAQFFEIGDGGPPGMPVQPATGIETFLNLRPADVDGDGDTDVVVRQPSEASPVALSLNRGDGTFESSSQELPAPPPFPGGTASYSRTIAQADFDGDGAEELLVRYSVQAEGTTTLIAEATHLLEFKASNGGSWIDLGPATSGALAQSADNIPLPPIFFQYGLFPQFFPWGAADADGDGDLDILVPSGIWRNDGTGFFSASNLAFDMAAPGFQGFLRAMDAADVDADGDLDLLALRVIDQEPAQVELLRRNGTSYTSEFLFEPQNANQFYRLEFRDLDDDGDPDVLGSQNDLEWLANHGGSFNGVLRQQSEVNQDPGSIFSGDVNNDGTPDLVFLSDSREVRHLRLAGPDLLFVPVTSYALPFGAGYSSLLDSDQDGDLDLVGLSYTPGTAADPAISGAISQFGAGTAMSGGSGPVLGAAGPLQSGVAAELRLIEAEAGSQAFLLIGSAATSIPNAPLPGLTQLVGGSVFLGPFPVTTAPGASGEGEVRLPIPTGSFLVGIELFLQGFTAGIDVGASNGLRLQFGA